MHAYPFGSQSRFIRTVILSLIFLFSKNGYSQTFSTPVPALSPYFGTSANVGQYLSMKVVNGNPAICFYDATRTALYYMRAADASGTTWNTPVAIDVVYNVGAFISLQIVNGKPAVAYCDITNYDLKYAQAIDVDGTSWKAPLTIDATGNVGYYNSLQVVNGNPAIAYYDFTNNDLKYVHATDVNGATWGVPQTIASAGDVGIQASMQVVNGNPAIAYYDASNADLKYVRATDADGNAWQTPQTLDGTGISVGNYSSLQIINGNPAVSYYDATNTDLKYIRATDFSGTAWGTPQTVDVNGGQSTSLRVVNGNPAIAYFDNTSSDLRYVQASDADGTAWGASQLLDATGIIGQYSCLQVVNGNPAIAHYDATNAILKFVRATDANGTAWGTQQSFNGIINDLGTFNSLRIVNGRPAFSCYDNYSQDLKFVRANDAAGTSWGAPLLVDGTGINAGSYSSLQIVNGNPAISYYEGTGANLKFVRAADANGTTWGTPLTIDAPGTVGQYTSLQIVNGNPAIAYYDATNTNLKYVQATDANGDTWGTPITLDVTTGTLGQYACLQVINGNPAIVYYDGTNGRLKYIRANDVNGATWGAAINIDASANVGMSPSLQVVNGYPAVSYFAYGSGDLKFVRATNANGGAWGAPVTLDATNVVGNYSSMQIVNGNPAISYFDGSNNDVKFIKATDASGSTWALPQTVFGAESVGTYISMVSQGNGAAIVFYNTSNGLPFFVTTTDFTILPVTLTKIAAQWKNTAVQLSWQVADESNIVHYIVERSADGKTFSKIGAVAAVNATYNHNYSYEDGSPLNGTNYYRLRIEETTGAVRYSTIVHLRPQGDTRQQVSVYPNPVKGNIFQFEANLPAGDYSLKLVNSAGVEMMYTTYQHAGGTVTQAIPVPQNMRSGVYHLIISNSKARATAAFVK